VSQKKNIPHKEILLLPIIMNTVISPDFHNNKDKYVLLIIPPLLGSFPVIRGVHTTIRE
jgi:hypothetical protein